MATLACDVLVIGGGATGVCAAYDLARRGVDVILVDKNDLTMGTSGRFHGLLHSGARYAVKDTGTAEECITENLILKRIVSHIVEDTGGLFVATPDDPADYIPRWVEACRIAGIETARVSSAELRKLEPALRADMAAAYRVPDAAVDGFDLGHAFSHAAESYGARTLIRHRVTALAHHNDGMLATVHDDRIGVDSQVEARWVLNAGGPWAGQIAALAGHQLTVHWSRGIMVAMNIRWVNTIINRLRPPDDGDILVPVGTVSVIGTTAVHVESPDDLTIVPDEVSQMLDDGEAIIPGFRQARALRAWAGIRPLYDPGESAQDDAADEREVKRGFAVIRHAPGMTSVVGGKLTTARMMAAQAVDDVCAGLGIDVPSTTADEVLPNEPRRAFHTLGHRLDQLEHGKMPGALICECEMITRPQLEAAIATYDQPPTLDDLRRDLRLGMGPCQGGFCAVRAAGILRYARDLPAPTAFDELKTFVAERFRGGHPLLWGQHLRQFLLDELLYRRTLGLDLEGRASRRTVDQMLPDWAQNTDPVPQASGQQVIVVGAGLAGLAAAVHAVQAGARVKVFALGLGRLILTPGWYQVGAFAPHPGVGAFRDWLEQFDGLRLAPDADLHLPTTLGIRHRVDLAPEGLAAGDLDHDVPTAIIGLAGWRDFDSAFYAGMRAAQGIPQRSIHVDLPGRHDAWDLSTTELATRFDDPAYRAEVARLVRGRLDGEQRVGFPAVLGLHDLGARADMADRIGVSVFEVPTMTPSVPGTRLYNTLKHWLLRHGAQIQVGHAVTRATTDGQRVTGVAVASAGRETVFPADAVILATGGLYGGGLLSDDRSRVWEPVFDLPVTEAGPRTGWFHDDLLNPAGHPVHKVGIHVDDQLRPLNEAGQPVYANLYAAGGMIAGLNTVTADCDEGVALASAYAAVRAALHASD
jgi:glycerol-3-phosphate dehydrogenase